jgi:hypothetical protein
MIQASITTHTSEKGFAPSLNPRGLNSPQMEKERLPCSGKRSHSLIRR